MRRAGVDLYLDSANWSVVGMYEGLKKSLFLWRRLLAIRRELREHRPDALVLIDYGFFNCRLAQAANRMGIRTLYYFPPRSWSRNPAGAARIADCVDAIATPFPWSAQALSGRHASVEWVGHPMQDVVKAGPAPQPAGMSPVVALAPGSREQEIRHVLPVMARAAALVKECLPGARFLVAVAPEVSPARIHAAMRRVGIQANLLHGMDYDALGNAHAAIVTSGTATLELALLRVPMVVIYRVDPLTLMQYHCVQALRRPIRFMAMPNILANRRIVPELRQHHANPRAVARITLRLLTDTDLAGKMRQDLAAISNLLGPGGAAEKTARIVLSLAGINKSVALAHA
jgi:lipid-A-disaccharide synthase